MAAGDLFDNLRRGTSPEYSWGGTGSGGRAFQRLNSPTTQQSPPLVRSIPTQRFQPTTFPKTDQAKRTDDGDRPSAWTPATAQTQTTVVRYEPPKFIEILKDLGLRLLEVIIAAVAEAAGREIAIYFSKRRFYTQAQRQRQEW